jgi:hypothetical protein
MYEDLVDEEYEVEYDSIMFLFNKENRMYMYKVFFYQ